MKPIRLVTRLIFIFLIGSLVGIALYVYFAPQQYLAFVMPGDPVVLVLIKPKGQKIVVFSLPADTYIEGVHGYGMYSLSSLWKLGTIDKNGGGTLLADSLTETLGLPITRFIGSEPVPAGSKPLTRVGRLFDWKNVVAYAGRGYITNMNLTEFIGVVKRLKGVRVGEIVEIDLGSTALFEKKSLPDGSVVSEVDPDRIDPIVGNAFENEQIRQEGKRISVVNTTDTGGLGGRVAKLVSHVGGTVVSVSNAVEPIDRCEIVTSKDNVNSKTVGFIRQYYDCVVETGTESDISDIVVRIGGRYAERFSPPSTIH